MVEDSARLDSKLSRNDELSENFVNLRLNFSSCLEQSLETSDRLNFAWTKDLAKRHLLLFKYQCQISILHSQSKHVVDRSIEKGEEAIILKMPAQSDGNHGMGL